MADYYPLLARALDALPDRSPALRKAVYDRARSALIGQLRNLEPPLPEADIDVERRALDAAIARLEGEYGEPAPEPAAPEARVPEPRAPTPPVPQPPVPQPPVPQPPTPFPRAPEPVLEPRPAPPSPAPMPDALGGMLPEAVPEPGPPQDFVPFVPPPRRARPGEPPAPEAAAGPSEAANGTPAAAEAVEAAAPGGARRPRLDVKAPGVNRSRRLRNLAVGAVLAVVIGLIAVAAILLADKRTDLPRSAGGDGVETAQPKPDAKLSDRVGGERTETAPAAGPDPRGRPDVMVAQRAVLYEENTADPKAQPTATQGRVVWRLEPVNGEQGQPLQSAVRANVEYPDAGLTLALTIRKNLDATLPASHTIELAFTNYGPGENRAVQEVGLLQLKDEESARGAPVSGLPVRVRDNLFLIGLSNLPADIERNTEMLTHRNWLDLAVKYKSGARAILSFEKGTAGTRVMQSAFDQWK